ncbi:M48 family metallopeptidase [Massilia horti]|uniref:Peptidase M48 n=1 Tax=Massilia horti TaxID=2562153 RepID=A0A4Y9SVH1_9BURK|nr:M48 family metallopeptidase [Massilia horti]TFW30465.1 peptidase M48 [Massilia horti]TFW30616.1 peptidase M48 [Massilia horti]
MTHIHRLRPAALGITIALLLSACGTQAPFQQGAAPAPVKPAPQAPALTPQIAADAETLTRMASLQERLYHVAAPLLINNADLCKTHARNLLGFTAKSRYSYPGSYNEAAHVAFGMGERLQVTQVLAGSGAAKAGLKVGDRLVSAGGKPLPSGPQGPALAGSVFGPLVAAQATLPLTIERDGKERQLTVPVTRACAYGIELGNSDNINSYADGSRIMVTRGMIGFTRNDDELAYVLAAGLAHNVLGHAAVQRNSATIGSIIDNLTRVKPDDSMLIGSGGIKAMPADQDVAADRLAIYMLARAGYDIDGVDEFWKRLAQAHPATVLNGYTANHPAVSTRVAAIQKTVAEVNAKRSAKKPLVP